MKREDKLEVKTVFRCLSCENAEFGRAEMISHLKEKHGIDTKTSKGTRSLILCLDGARQSFSNTFEWKLGDLTFQETTSRGM